MLSDNNKHMLHVLFESDNKLTATNIKNEFTKILNDDKLSSEAKRDQLIVVIDKIKKLPQIEVHKLTDFVRKILHTTKNIDITNLDDIKRQLKTVMAPEDLTNWSDTLKDFAMYGSGVVSAVTGLMLMGLIFTKQKENENIY